MFELLQIKSFPDFCGVVGLAVSVFGFVVTYRAARAAKSAAEQARAAAIQMRDDLNKFDLISTLSETMTSMEEAKTLQSEGVWQLLPAKYSSLRKSLITIKTVSPGLTNQHRRALQSAIQTCAGIEDEILVAKAAGGVPQDMPRLNRTLNDHINNLQSVLLHVRSEIGGIV